MYVNGGGQPVSVFVTGPAILSWGLQALVRSSPRLALAGAADSFEAAARALAAAPADVVLADVDDPAQCRELPAFLGRTQARVLVLSGLPELGAFDEAIMAGLQGIVRKSESPQLLVNAIEKVHRGELWLDRGITGRIFMTLARRRAAERNDPERIKIAALTLREREAIAAIVADTAAPAKVIAARLAMSEHTLRNHLTSIYSKLHLTNRLDLYAYAMQNKIGEGM